MESLKQYKNWLNTLHDDHMTTSELLAIAEDEKDIYDRFYRNLAFGTGGMRGVIGAGTNRMNRYTVRKATLGFARYLKTVKGQEMAKQGVVIAHDNRHMSRDFCMETAGVLAAEGIRAYIFDSLRPTPELSFAVRYLQAAGGVMITASHNPPEYNGYKVYDEQGCQLIPQYTDILIEMIGEIEDPLHIPVLTEEQAKDLIVKLPATIDEAYYNAVAAIRLRPDVNAQALTVVYSPQHGTGNLPVREVLSRAGYRVIPVLEQCPPDPDFSATKNPNPELPEAYELCVSYAEKADADIAITTDPDCDRLGVAVRNGNDYTLISGNQSGAILLEYILSTRKEHGTLPPDAVMCNTIVTSTLGDRIAEKYGVRVEKTLTGFKFIGEKIRQYETQGTGTYVFGYEESYGCLIADFARDKDGVQASLMLCEAAAYYKTMGKTLLDVLQDIYTEHGYYLDSLTNIVHKGADGVAKIASLLEILRKDPPKEAGGIAIVEIEDYLSEQMRKKGFPASNVLRYLLADGSFVAVRPSGTEPKCKYYYCIVGKDRVDADEKLQKIRRVFEK